MLVEGAHDARHVDALLVRLQRNGAGDRRFEHERRAVAVQEAQQMNKRFPAALNAYALMLKSRGDLKGANNYYHRALMQAADTMPVIHYNFAILLEKTEKSRDAVREYKRYLALAPAGKNAKQARERLKRLTGDTR